MEVNMIKLLIAFVLKIRDRKDASLRHESASDD